MQEMKKVRVGDMVAGHDFRTCLTRREGTIVDTCSLYVTVILESATRGVDDVVEVRLSPNVVVEDLGTKSPNIAHGRGARGWKKKPGDGGEKAREKTLGAVRGLL